MQQAGDVKELTAGLIRIGTFSSVATHWLPSIIREFQKDYPNIEYEFLLGDYREIEAWIQEGRVDCGFLCLPVRPDLDTIFLERDDFLATLPTAHPLAQAERIFLDALCKEPFLIPYQVAVRETVPSFHRDIVLALRDRKTAPLAVRRFLEYLPHR